MSAGSRCGGGRSDRHLLPVCRKGEDLLLPATEVDPDAASGAKPPLPAQDKGIWPSLTQP